MSDKITPIEALNLIIGACTEIGMARCGLDNAIERIKKYAHKGLESVSETADLSADELWDEYSELIDDDNDSLTRWAGSVVIDKENFKKLINRLQR